MKFPNLKNNNKNNNNEAMVEGKEKELRADAPAFVPSFKVYEYISDSNFPSNDTRKDQRARKNHSKEGSTPKKKNHRRRRKNKKSKPSHSSEQKALDHVQISSTRNHRRRHYRSITNSTEEQNDETSSRDITIPLHEETFFPSLVHESKPKATPNNSSSTIWVDPSHKPEIFLPPTEAKDGELTVGELSEDDFMFLGLQKLKSSRRIQEHEKTLTIQNTSFDITKNTINSSGTVVESSKWDNTPSRRRPRWNMDRLRDRWWQTLKQRQIFQQVMMEMQSSMKIQKFDPDDISMSSESSGSSISKSHLEPVDVRKLYQPERTTTSSLNTYIQNDSDKSYFEILQDAIIRDNEDVLKELILWCRDDHQTSVPLKQNQEKSILVSEAVTQCIEQDKSHLLRIVLHNSSNLFGIQDKLSKDFARERLITPLMVAAELGHADCLLVLLSKQGHDSNFVAAHDANGDNIFHYCCRGQGDESVLRVTLKQLSTGPKSKQHQLSKMLLGKNNSGKTPLHVACEQGRVDLVETFLSVCNTAVLSKMLSVTDNENQTPLLAAVAANSTDVVMSLIMWRGNHHFTYQKNHQGNTSEQTITNSCPLVWAAKMGNLEMIFLLLQFMDSSGTDYHTTEAIPALMLSGASDDLKSDGIEALIQAGGNPFGDVSISNNSGKIETAINVASRSVSINVLKRLIETGRKALRHIQGLRRRDPKLRQQPESFFQAMETTENDQMNIALKFALLESLYYGWHSYYREPHHTKMMQHLSSAATLYKHGARLVESDLIRLHASLHTESITTDTSSYQEVESMTFMTTYHQQLATESVHSSWKVSDLDRSMLARNSQLLCRTAWLRDQVDDFGTSCPWLSSNYNVDFQINESRDDKVILVANDDEKFVVHNSVVSQKSVKLASAIRFAKMKNESSTTHKVQYPEIRIDIDPRLCKFMLQHIYHGSICTGWAKDNEDICQDLLDLMICAEEALCVSLVQECEMRLLSSDPTRCFCWSCAKSIQNTKDNKFIECMYRVEGPSRLLTGRTALDTLAIVQYFESLQLDYEIKALASSLSSLRYMTFSKDWANMKVCERNSAISTLKTIAIQTILLDFKNVIESDTFQESIEWNNDPSNLSNLVTQQVLLLQTCLEEVFNSTLPLNYGKFNPTRDQSALFSCKVK